jgi:3D (Asp-Asp-Asp) domain-containing protein
VGVLISMLLAILAALSPAPHHPAPHHPAPALTVAAPPAPASRSLARPAVAEVLSVTAYCATGSVNAAGHYPRAGEAAGNRWPLGTVLSVPRYGRVTVEDRIGHGSDLDLYFGAQPDCEQRARAWGRQALAVTEVP